MDTFLDYAAIAFLTLVPCMGVALSAFTAVVAFRGQPRGTTRPWRYVMGGVTAGVTLFMSGIAYLILFLWLSPGTKGEF